MTIKNAIYYGLVIIAVGNVIIYLIPKTSLIALIALTLILCYLISEIDISKSSPDAYYEVGFTFTIISIICSMILLGISGLGEDGFVVILGNFGIALFTSAFGLILRSSTENLSYHHDINEYNKSIQDLSSALQLVTNDLNKATIKLIDKINKQSNKLDEISKKFTSGIDDSLNKLDEKIEDNSRSQSILEKSIQDKLNNFSENVADYTNKFSSFSGDFIELKSQIDSHNIDSKEIKTELTTLKHYIKENSENLSVSINSNIEKYSINIGELGDKLDVSLIHLNDVPSVMRASSDDIKNQLLNLKSSIISVDSKLTKYSSALNSPVNRYGLKEKVRNFWAIFNK